jgi:hypothetical protein
VVLAKIRELEQRIEKLRDQHAGWAERAALKRQLLAISEEDVRHVLAGRGAEIKQGEQEGAILDLLYSEKHRIAKPELRQVLRTIVERVELDPKTREFTINRLPVQKTANPRSKLTGVKLASPRGLSAFIHRLQVPISGIAIAA